MLESYMKERNECVGPADERSESRAFVTGLDPGVRATGRLSSAPFDRMEDGLRPGRGLRAPTRRQARPSRPAHPRRSKQSTVMSRPHAAPLLPRSGSNVPGRSDRRQRAGGRATASRIHAPAGDTGMQDIDLNGTGRTCPVTPKVSRLPSTSHQRALARLDRIQRAARANACNFPRSYPRHWIRT